MSFNLISAGLGLFVGEVALKLTNTKTILTCTSYQLWPGKKRDPGHTEGNQPELLANGHMPKWFFSVQIRSNRWILSGSRLLYFEINIVVAQIYQPVWKKKSFCFLNAPKIVLAQFKISFSLPKYRPKLPIGLWLVKHYWRLWTPTTRFTGNQLWPGKKKDKAEGNLQQEFIGAIAACQKDFLCKNST